MPWRLRAFRASVQTAAERMQGLGEVGVGRSQADGGLELAQRLPPTSLLEVDPTQVHERELAGFVAPRLVGPPEPRDRLLELAMLHEVHADVVVRVAEVGVDLDGPQALGRRL